jgi:hypothetical protein
MRVVSRDSASPTNHQPPDCKVGIWVAYPEAILLGQCETGDDVAWSGMVKGAYWLRLRRQEARPRLTLAGWDPQDDRPSRPSSLQVLQACKLL